MSILNVVFGAVLAWAAHSSVAVVLLVISLAYSNFITPIVAFALVLGANLGSAINPLVEGGSLQNPVARRLPLGNLINRVVGCALVLPFLQPAVDLMSLFDTSPVRMIADFHSLFNMAWPRSLSYRCRCSPGCCNGYCLSRPPASIRRRRSISTLRR